MAAATRARRNISRPRLPPEYLPPKTPAQNSRSNISRPNLPSLVVILSEKGGGGGASSPDWRTRGVTRPGGRNAPLQGFSGSTSKGGRSSSLAVSHRASANRERMRHPLPLSHSVRQRGKEDLGGRYSSGSFGREMPLCAPRCHKEEAYCF